MNKNNSNKKNTNQDLGLLGGRECLKTSPRCCRNPSRCKASNFGKICFRDFRGSDFQTIFEKVESLWHLRANPWGEKDPILILFMSGVRNFLSKVLLFTSEIPLFHRDPLSSVRPSEASLRRFLCFHPHPQPGCYWMKENLKNITTQDG